MRPVRKRGQGALAALGTAAALLALTGCERLPLATGLPPSYVLDCSLCHGGEDNFAPPAGLAGQTDTSEIGVGAHQIHLRGGLSRAAIGCGECHLVPTAVGDEGHLDTAPADLMFGALARTTELVPSWDRGAARCASTYCHGGSLSGGEHTAPIWTQVNGTQNSCHSCHGNPPPPPHPPHTNCDWCHPDTALEGGGVDIDGGFHINGTLEAKDECYDCHGSEASAAPPPDLDGLTDTSEIGVGAHATHLSDGILRQAIHCEECHAVPTDVLESGHIDDDDLTAEVTFGALSSADGAQPTWIADGTPPTCSSVYCHGATLLGGGTVTAPSWTVVDGTQAACGSCHGLPPPPPHVANNNCVLCHDDTLLDTGAPDVAAGFHINGTTDYQFPTACNACHGSDDNDAPPTATDGSTATSAISVGAHQAHLVGGVLGQQIACDACHVVPADALATGHLDDAPAEVVFSGLATSDGAQPVWDRDADPPTCASTYCHGATLIGGGSVAAPAWTTVDGSQIVCGACHGLPPPAPHPQNPGGCEGCHPRTVVQGFELDLTSGTHIDGMQTFF